jgi:hypothetical protein
MSTRADLSIKFYARLTQEQKERFIEQTILEELPDLPYYSSVSGSGYEADGTVYLKVSNGTQLLEAYKAFPPIDLVMSDDTFLSFIPKKNAEGKTGITNIYPFYYELTRTSMDHPTNISFIWYTRLNNLCVKVDVVVEFNFQFMHMPELSFGPITNAAGKTIDYKWEATTGLINSGTRAKMYTADNTSARYYFYWVESETSNLADLIPFIWMDLDKEENVQVTKE